MPERPPLIGAGKKTHPSRIPVRLERPDAEMRGFKRVIQAGYFVLLCPMLYQSFFNQGVFDAIRRQSGGCRFRQHQIR